jgi:hypothetical protein
MTDNLHNDPFALSSAELRRIAEWMDAGGGVRLGSTITRTPWLPKEFVVSTACLSLTPICIPRRRREA